MKTLDSKLKAITSGKYQPEHFILSDAKDPDMALGVTAPGPHGTRAAFLDAMRAIVSQKLMDVMLGSASNIEELARTGVFAKSGVTPAIRANDTTDIWLPRHGSYSAEPSRPFRSASLAHARKFCDLGLYSVTFNNILSRDYDSVEHYARFRDDALKLKFRHFLEVFSPNAAQDLKPAETGAFVNDCILRILAGVTRAERPLFLKMQFYGARAMSELASYDPGLVVGILGGSAGTTRDTFELLTQAERNGARVALFGRKINLAESALDLVALFRPVLERSTTPADAVKAYHAVLAKKKIASKRPLEDDQAITEPALEGHRG